MHWWWTPVGMEFTFNDIDSEQIMARAVNHVIGYAEDPLDLPCRAYASSMRGYKFGAYSGGLQEKDKNFILVSNFLKSLESNTGRQQKHM